MHLALSTAFRKDSDPSGLHGNLASRCDTICFRLAGGGKEDWTVNLLLFSLSDQSNIRKERFLQAYSLRVQPIMAGP